jgi:peptidoglycan/LPS O-acetylase OafA/YrhL
MLVHVLYEMRGTGDETAGNAGSIVTSDSGNPAAAGGGGATTCTSCDAGGTRYSGSLQGGGGANSSINNNALSNGTSTVLEVAQAKEAVADATAVIYPLASAWPLNSNAPTRPHHYALHIFAVLIWGWISYTGDGTDKLREIPVYFGPDSTFNAFTAVCSQTLYGTCVAYGLLLCLLGRVPVLSWVLSLDIWVPFARLSYSAYLLQFVIIDKLVPVVDLNDNDSSGQALAKWLLLVVASVLGVFGLSAATFLAVEQPCISMR